MLAAGALAGGAWLGFAPSSQAACPSTGSGSEVAGGVYTSGNGGLPDPATLGDPGYIGAGGTSPAGDGYVEVGGDLDEPTGGYIVAYDNTTASGNVVYTDPEASPNPTTC